MGKKYNFVYKTTHKESGKYYIGVHSTDNMNDGYLGSGLRIKSSIKKYGEDAFEREVLKYFDNKKDAYSYENEIVTSETLKDTYCMNIKEGGIGGYGMSGEKNGMYRNGHLISGEKHPMFGKKHSDESRKKMTDNHARFMLGKKHSKETTQKMRDNHSKCALGKVWINDGVISRRIDKGVAIPVGWSLGRGLSEESKRKIGDASKGRFFSKEARDKISKVHKGKSKSKETRGRISNAQKGEKNHMYGKMFITNGVKNDTIKKGDAIPIGWRRGMAKKK